MAYATTDYGATIMGSFPLQYPDGWGFGLLGVYLAWIVVLITLYPLCKWFAGVKRRRNVWWLSYL